MKIFKIVSAIIFVVILIYSYIPVKEAYTLKEASTSDSVGNCRIVNTVESINNNLELKIYYYDKVAKNGINIRHVIAVNSNNKIVDKSDLRPDENGKIPESLDGKDLNNFENRDKDTPHLEFIYSKEHKVNIINEISDTYIFIAYIKVFSLAYKIFH